MLLCDYYAPGGLYYLCNYTFPDTFELLDSFSSSTITFYLNDNYLFGHKDLDGDASFYTWQNDEIELVQSYEFEVEQYNAFLLPEESRFIAGGRYNVQEYSCDFVSVNDHQITVPDAQLSNYPNPFNPSTTIQFETTNLHKFAQIEIYNIKGQKVRTLPVSPTQNHTVSVVWDGTNDTGQAIGSGVYFYQLQIDKKPVASRKCLLLK